MITSDASYIPENMGEFASQQIWLETEDGNLYQPMETVNDLNASNGGYIQVPGGYGRVNVPGQETAHGTYVFDIQEAGEYVIWGRVISNNTSADSFHVSIDGGENLAWHTMHGGMDTWVWDVVSYRAPSDLRDTSSPMFYHLEAGSHTLTISQREAETKLDVLMITNDTSYVPE